MNKIINKIFCFNIPRTEEESKTFKIAIISNLLFITGIIYDFIINKSDSYIRYVILSIIIMVICLLMLTSIRLYELYIYMKADYIWYIVKDGETLVYIAKKYLPECNPWRTVEVIKEKNNISNEIYTGTRILIPTKK